MLKKKQMLLTKKIAQEKHLFENFEERKIHTNLVPPLGGIAIFIGFVAAIVSNSVAEFLKHKTKHDLSFITQRKM